MSPARRPKDRRPDATDPTPPNDVAPSLGASSPAASDIRSQAFNRSVLLIPKEEFAADPQTTFSLGAVRRAYRHPDMKLRVPVKSAATALQDIGMADIEKAQQTKEHLSERGGFARLSTLGLTVAFFGNASDEADALTELSEEYDFVPDFALSLPPRLRAEHSPATRGRAALAQREWPHESGVADAHDRGIRGAGVLVGVLDTGVDADHTEFADRTVPFRYVSLFPNSPYWPPRDVRGFDTDGHGTHVSGIVAGQSTGVAPESELYVASVIESETTRTSLTRVASGLNWILRQFTRPDNEHRPAVLNMSLGFAPESLTSPDLEQRLRVMRRLLNLLLEANILPVVAIGNDGPGRFGYPGAFEEVLGVGAVDFDHQVAPFSGDMPAPSPSAKGKPDMVGYGVGVYSSVERDYSGASVYQRFDGTSMAAPYVAGVAALYRCQHPLLTAEQVWDKMGNSALALPQQPAARVGAGLARFVP